MFELTLQLDEKRLAELLCSGIEGGISYWAQIQKYIPPPEENRYRFDPDHRFRHIDFPMSEGGAVWLRITEGGDVNGQREFKLDRPSLERGLSLMAAKHPEHLADWLKGSDDATTGDVLIQLALFGELVFG